MNSLNSKVFLFKPNKITCIWELFLNDLKKWEFGEVGINL